MRVWDHQIPIVGNLVSQINMTPGEHNHNKIASLISQIIMTAGERKSMIAWEHNLGDKLGVRKNTRVIVIIFYIVRFSLIVLGGRDFSPV